MALFKIRAVSVISTMNVLWPRASSSLAPTRAKMRSAIPMRGTLCRHKTADLRHQRQQGDLPDVGAFAGHVRAGDQQDLSFVVARTRVVGHKCALRFENIQDRMATVRRFPESVRRPLGRQYC